jgi:hypothetical protein
MFDPTDGCPTCGTVTRSHDPDCDYLATQQAAADADAHAAGAISPTRDQIATEAAAAADIYAADQQNRTAADARDAAELVTHLGLGAVTVPLVRLLNTAADHALDGALFGVLPMRVRALARAIRTLPAVTGRVPHVQAVSDAVEHALLTLNADPELEPNTAWYGERVELSGIERGQGIRNRISLVRLHDDAAMRAGLLDDVTDGEVYGPAGADGSQP